MQTADSFQLAQHVLLGCLHCSGIDSSNTKSNPMGFVEASEEERLRTILDEEERLRTILDVVLTFFLVFLSSSCHILHSGM